MQVKVDASKLKRLEVLEMSVYVNKINDIVEKYESIEDAVVILAINQLVLQCGRLNVRYEA
jgi:hypothetical protein